VDGEDDIHVEMLEMIKAIPPKLLNQLMKETETAMNQRSMKDFFNQILEGLLGSPQENSRIYHNDCQCGPICALCMEKSLRTL
jgi:hypothetical protein